MSRVMHPAAVVEYPYSDGRPRAESEAQLRAIVYPVAALYGHFRDRSDVYVGGDMFVYYEERNLGRWWRRTCTWWWERRSGRRPRD